MIKALELTLPATEYSFELPVGTVGYAFKARDPASTYYFADVIGVVAGGAEGVPAGDYCTYGAGQASNPPHGVVRSTADRTLYFSTADVGGAVIEIVYWRG